MTETLHFSCDCQKVTGKISQYEASLKQHLTCYCSCCRGFMKHLGCQDKTVDPNGGINVIHLHPRQISFEAGSEYLRPLKLTDKPTYRWYTTCCQTPIATTPKTAVMPFVSLSTYVLKNANDRLGPVTGHVHLDTALQDMSQLKSQEVSMGYIMKKVVKFMIREIFTRPKTRNPFFDSKTKKPIFDVIELSLQEQKDIGIIGR